VRFDWYAATVREPAADVVDQLAAALGATTARGAGLYGYAEQVQLHRGEEKVGSVLHGGKNPWPHVSATGSHAPAMAEQLRQLHPERHAVTRMDACEDLDDGDGTWAQLYAPLLALALERNLTIDQAGDWARERDGRTFYVGSPRSAVRVRLYEKGKQLRVTGADPAASLDLVRLEVQVRPEGPSRLVAAVGAPADAFGYSDWSQAAAQQLLGLDVPRVHVKDERPRDDERALRAVASQYAAVFQREAEQLGSWDLLWARLERLAKRQLQERGQ
jgi:DNA relaxase NicK